MTRRLLLRPLPDLNGPVGVPKVRVHQRRVKFGPARPLTPLLQILDVEDSQVGEGSSELAPPPYMCDFIMEGTSLSSNEGVRPWLERHGGKVADCVGKCPSPSYGHGESEGDGWGGNAFGLKEERGADLPRHGGDG